MRTTAGQLEEFKKSFIWLDILDELDVWLDQIHLQLENADGHVSHRTLDKLAGNCETIRNVRDILDVMINLALEEVENGRRE
jgi:hypothetical protein